MRILVTGSTGQVGGALVTRLSPLGSVMPLTHADLDLAAGASIGPTLDRLSPDLIINPAAYTAVDQAEEEPDLAYAINAEAPKHIAGWAAAHCVPLVHLSTDYVFDGTGDRPWHEEDMPRPLSVYGVSKLTGEQQVRAANGPHLIVRTSWVYASQGRNFMRTVARLAGERAELHIVADQIGAPTPARVVADAIGRIVAAGRFDLAGSFTAANGLVHLSTVGETSWHGFASAIVEGLRAQGTSLTVRSIVPIATQDYPTKAKRPANSRLSLERLRCVFGIVTPRWDDALAVELDDLVRSYSAG